MKKYKNVSIVKNAEGYGVRFENPKSQYGFGICDEEQEYDGGLGFGFQWSIVEEETKLPKEILEVKKHLEEEEIQYFDELPEEKKDNILAKLNILRDSEAPIITKEYAENHIGGFVWEGENLISFEHC